MKKSGLSSFVNVLSIIYTILYVIVEIELLVMVARKFLTWWLFLTVTLSLTIALFLLYALANAHNRISKLEDVLLQKEIVNESELGDEADNEIINEPSSLCDNCGYQLFEDDEICPFCNTPRKKEK